MPPWRFSLEARKIRSIGDLHTVGKISVAGSRICSQLQLIEMLFCSFLPKTVQPLRGQKPALAAPELDPGMAPAPALPPLVVGTSGVHVSGCCCGLQAREMTKSLIWCCQAVELVRGRYSSTPAIAGLVALPEAHSGMGQRYSAL